MPILWAIEEFDVPDEAAALLDTKTRHKKFNIPPRSKVNGVAIGTLDTRHWRLPRGQRSAHWRGISQRSHNIGDVSSSSSSHDATSRATVLLFFICLLGKLTIYLDLSSAASQYIKMYTL